MQFLPTLASLAVISVLVVLVLGLLTMLRGGNPNTSQKLMRWRIGLQFLAIVVLMVTLYFYSN